MSEKLNIGFIGLGNLGTPIAMNLLESGNKILVYNRSIQKTIPLKEKGALVAKDPAELAAQCDIVFSIVSDDAAIRSLCEGQGGLIQHLKKKSIHVSMSTILPETAELLAKAHEEKEQYYLAAPVFGRPEAAVQKKLNFAISGQPEIRKKVEPILKQAGAFAVWDFGDSIRAANTIKLCGNYLIAAAINAIGESISLANSSGINATQMWSMLGQTLFNAPVYQNYSKIILEKKFEPASFTAKLGLKDLNLVLHQANSVNQPMPLAELVRENMQILVDTGRQDMDWSAIGLLSK
jgi:3-hydroxyisobutyrate dehydrogenase-like beta-hydroxyacid dehydrogenase